MISFIGMILGLLLFVVLAFKGFNLILSAVASSCLMFVFSGISILDGLKEFYLPGLAGFLQSYFLLFFLSALMGKLMSDGGNAKKIALSLSGLIKKSKNNQKFFCVLLVPVLYFLLCYVGISGFVVVFTVLPIAKTIYEETDTPWRLYCCAGAQTVSAAYLAGSIQAGNVYATDICGTTTMAGWKLSIVAVVTFWAVSLVFLWTMLKITQKKGEAFLPSGEGIRMANLDEGLSEDCLPGLLPSILPLAVVLVLSAGFQVYVVKALFAGCILTVITGHKNLLPKLKTSLSQGITAAYGPILSVSATYAIGAVVKNIEGFTYFQNMLSALPHLMSGSLMGLLAAFIMASVAAPIPAFGSHMLDQYTLAGLSAGNAHRMMMLTSFTSIAPHNAGIPNAAAVLRMPYAECLKMYMMSTYIPGFITLFVSILCIKMGIV